MFRTIYRARYTALFIPKVQSSNEVMSFSRRARRNERPKALYVWFEHGALQLRARGGEGYRTRTGLMFVHVMRRIELERSAAWPSLLPNGPQEMVILKTLGIIYTENQVLGRLVHGTTCDSMRHTECQESLSRPLFR